MRPYSRLETLIQEDMKKAGIDYPHCSVDDVKNFWKEKLNSREQSSNENALEDYSHYFRMPQ